MLVSCSVQVDIIHKRLHKDILHNPVVMLNFCPDLQSKTSDLRKVQGEFIFLIDRSGSMSGVNMSRVKVSQPSRIFFVRFIYIFDGIQYNMIVHQDEIRVRVMVSPNEVLLVITPPVKSLGTPSNS